MSGPQLTWLSNSSLLRAANALSTPGAREDYIQLELRILLPPDHFGFAVLMGLSHGLGTLAQGPLPATAIAALRASGCLAPVTLTRLAESGLRLNVASMSDGSVVSQHQVVAVLDGLASDVLLAAEGLRVALRRPTTIATQAARLRLMSPKTTLIDGSAMNEPTPELAVMAGAAAQVGGIEQTLCLWAATRGEQALWRGQHLLSSYLPEAGQPKSDSWDEAPAPAAIWAQTPTERWLGGRTSPASVVVADLATPCGLDLQWQVVAREDARRWQPCQGTGQRLGQSGQIAQLAPSGAKLPVRFSNDDGLWVATGYFERNERILTGQLSMVDRHGQEVSIEAPRATPLLEAQLRNGRLLRQRPSAKEAASRAKSELAQLPPATRALSFAQPLPEVFSPALWQSHTEASPWLRSPE